MIEKAKKIFIPITIDKLDRAVSYPIGNLNGLIKDFTIFIPGKSGETGESASKVIASIGRNHFIFTGE
jgi:hypothetical protein